MRNRVFASLLVCAGAAAAAGTGSIAGKVTATPEKYLRPRDKVFTMGYQPAGDQLELGAALAKEYELRPRFELTNCTTCHR